MHTTVVYARTLSPCICLPADYRVEPCEWSWLQNRCCEAVFTEQQMKMAEGRLGMSGDTSVETDADAAGQLWPHVCTQRLCCKSSKAVAI